MSTMKGPLGTTKNVMPKGVKAGQIRQFTPEQMKLFKEMFGEVSPESFTGKLAAGDESQFEQMEAPAMRQFGALQSSAASKYSQGGQYGQGQRALGSRRSSGFQNEMTSANQTFAERLQGNRLALRNQAIKDLMGMSSDLLGQRPYDVFGSQKAPKQRQDEAESSSGSGWGSIAGSLLGGAAGFFAGGPAGALTGAGLGNAIGSKF